MKLIIEMHKKTSISDKGFLLILKTILFYNKVALEVIAVSKSFEIGQFFSALVTSS